MVEIWDFVGPDIQENFLTLLLFTFSISIYGIIIYAFYRFIARRDIFGFNVKKYMKAEHEGFISKIYNFSLNLIKYGLFYPIIVFLWFGIFSIMLFAFSKDQPIETLLTIAITVVSAIRVTAYFKEDLSRDLAKLLPLALLATFLIDPNFFSLELVEQRLYAVPDFINNIIQFVIFSILLEWILRILFFFKVKLFGLPDEMLKKEKEELSSE